MDHFNKCDNQPEDQDCICEDVKDQMEQDVLDSYIDEIIEKRDLQTCEFCRGFVVEDECTICNSKQMYL